MIIKQAFKTELPPAQTNKMHAYIKLRDATHKWIQFCPTTFRRESLSI